MVAGARLAEPGEFTFRAFLNQRIDLVQAEAVATSIEAVTPVTGARRLRSTRRHADDGDRARRRASCSTRVRLEASLDFPDDGYHFIESSDAAREIARVKGSRAMLVGSASRGR